jgi:putative lipoprotein
MKRNTFIYLLTVVLLTPLMHACSMLGLSSEPQTLSGQAFYRERIALPPGAHLIVTLEELSRTDAPSKVIAEQKQKLTGSPPYPFLLQYETAAIQNGERYGVRARIEHDGKLQFTTTRYLDPFGQTPPQESLQLLLYRTGPKGVQPLSILDTTWQVTQLNHPHVTAPPEGEAPFFELSGESHRVRGFSGCNTFGGGYLLEKQSLSFDKLFGTLMHCESSMAFETALLEAFSQVDAFRISADQLSLMDKSGTVLIQAQASVLNGKRAEAGVR